MSDNTIPEYLQPALAQLERPEPPILRTPA